MKHLTNSIFTSLLASVLISAMPVQAQQLSIQLPQPSWELDASVVPLQEREAGLTPEEEPLAEQLRPLIAAGTYNDAIKILEQSDQNHFSAAMHFVLAQLYLAQGQFTQAGQSYRATLQLMPAFLRAHRGLAVVYLQAGKLLDARTHLRQALMLGASDAQLYGQLSYLNLQDDKVFSAVSGYQQALFLEPDNPQWQQGLLYALIRSGDLQPARRLLEELLSEQADDATLWLQYSNIALQTQDNIAALSGLEFAIRLGERQAENISVAGQLHLQAGNPERGAALLQEALQLAPASYQNLSGIIDWLIESAQWPEAKAIINSAAQNINTLDSHLQSTLHTQQARILQEDNKPDAAISVLTQALTLDPANGRALMTLAGLLETDNPHHAETLYARAQVLSDVREVALLAHASLAARRQDHALALTLLEQAYQDNPQRSDLAHNIDLLQDLVARQ